MVKRFMCRFEDGMCEEEGASWIDAEDYDKLRLLLAEVILRFAVFDGEFMTRLVDSLEEG